MANAQITAQLEHLRAAAHALATTAPAISAHLMSRFMSLSSENSLSIADQPKACSACGTLWIPGGNDSVRTVYEEEEHKQKPRNQETWITYQCLICHKVTDEDVPSQPQPTTQAENLKKPGKPSEATASSPPPPPKTLTQTRQAAATSTTSVARKKSRKGASSLSKMLAAQKQGTSGGGGREFDLFDLMKTA
ncbi:hypothetical protein K440DRAFT_644829 [Wilcoxina mikolae CBS 423.85]|nr:hypothetical protein K440DRAFT_644829 [Wilcoxina mikolae CBS 423.85]